MLVHEDIGLHNVEEIARAHGGLRLARVPEPVRQHLNDTAQQRMLEPAGVELRFVADGPVILTLSCPEADPVAPPVASLYHGTFQALRGRSATVAPLAIGSQPMRLRLEPARLPRLLPPSVRRALPFAPEVTRLLLPYFPGPVILHQVEAESPVRPPRLEELPSLRLLFYGTSITQGMGASLPQLTYANQCAVRLGADAINLGSGGSAHCEGELADYIASRPDWDAAVLELSVNMREFPEHEFCRRIRYMIKTVASTRRPVFCLTLWPYRDDHGITPPDQPEGGRPEVATRMRSNLREVVASCGQANVHLLEGPSLFGPFAHHSADLLHPGDNAMIEMGWRLAGAIRSYLPDGPTRRSARPGATP